MTDADVSARIDRLERLAHWEDLETRIARLERLATVALRLPLARALRSALTCRVQFNLSRGAGRRSWQALPL